MRMNFKMGFKALDQIPDAVSSMVSLAVRKSAFDVQARAQSAIPVDTGAAKASIFVVVGDDNGYAQAIDDAETAHQTAHKSKHPSGADAEPLDFFPEIAGPVAPMQAYVAVAVMYGWFLENGTTRTAARPFLAPAMAYVQPFFEIAIGQAVLKGAQQAAKSGGLP